MGGNVGRLCECRDTPQVSGYLISQNYKEGSAVSKGQALFEIDPGPFQSGLGIAKGELARAQAELGKNTLDVERDTPLAEKKLLRRPNWIQKSRRSSQHRRPSNRLKQPWNEHNSILAGPKLHRSWTASRELPKSKLAI